MQPEQLLPLVNFVAARLLLPQAPAASMRIARAASEARVEVVTPVLACVGGCSHFTLLTYVRGSCALIHVQGPQSALALAGQAAAFWRLPCRSQTGVARIDPLVDPGSIADHVHTIAGGGGMSDFIVLSVTAI